MTAKRLLLLWLMLAPLGIAQVYKITDLGTLGGDFSEASSINALGDVAGDSCVDLDCSELHPFVWMHATGLFDLGTLPHGSTYAVATYWMG
jgi:uncharacterized membrane protein